jgi:hypothetical protein
MEKQAFSGKWARGGKSSGEDIDVELTLIMHKNSKIYIKYS